MKTSYEEGYLKIDLAAIVERMSVEDKAKFFEDLVFEEKIIQMFSDYFTSDYVFDSSKWFNTYSTGKPIKRMADVIRSKFLSAHSEVYKMQIEKYQKDLNNLAEKEEQYRSSLWSLENSIKGADYSNDAYAIVEGKKYYVQAADAKKAKGE